MKETNDVDRLYEMLRQTPLLFPFQWNTSADAIDFVGIQEAEYSQASFLDNRVIHRESVWGRVPIALLNDIQPYLRPKCDFIFHVSHCGSTLLSRLLGLHRGCFALREPLILRDFDSKDISEIETLFGLLSRTFHPEQTSLIKVTSFASQFASTWLSVLTKSKAILMTLSLETFLAAVLDGSLSDIESQKVQRFIRLERLGIRLPSNVESLSPGPLAAMSWLCEMLSLEVIHKRFPDRCHWLSFEQLLENPGEILTQVVEFLGYTEPHPAWEDHPLWTQYAKHPGVFYDSHLRMRLLVDSRKKFEHEIHKGLNWFEGLSEPRVAALGNQR
ncbi:MAG: hypothetical protein KGQ60_04180 [Planctomycetes bacterium]|nr:hypothetical protein [Planctomycetota bacterium]